MTTRTDAMGNTSVPAGTRLRGALSQETVDRAIHWRVLLQSGRASAADVHAWQRWLDDAPEHAEAWLRLEAIDGKVRGLPKRLAHATLERGTPVRRRALLALSAGTLLLVLGSRTPTWQGWHADYQTAVGERRRIRLDDGTVIDMNTDTAFNVKYDAAQRLLTLVRGEIFVETGGHDQRTPLPPFFAHNRDGVMQALGTRFQVRQRDDDTTLVVHEHAVALRPDDDWQTRTVNTGEAVRFNHSRILAVTEALNDQASWRDGVLVARRMRLDAFLAELGRYRPGWLRCDERVAGLLLSGTFPLDDTDLALNAVADALPVRIERHTRYWVTVAPKEK